MDVFEFQDRTEGCLLGLAVGDAVGTTLEFRPPGTFVPITEMEGGGPFHLEAGQWTDDTSMALCLANSLLECGGFDPEDQMKRYVRWRDHGYESSTGECFDIGNTVNDALRRFEKTGNPIAGDTDPQSAGNGSVMRLAPVPLHYWKDAAVAVDFAARSSTTTHGAREAIDGCRLFAGLLVGAIRGESKESLLSPGFAPGWIWKEQDLSERVFDISRGSYLSPEAEIRGSGYVVECLEAAMWAFATTDTFEAGVLAAANLGNDADTTAAIFGQLGGAYYGADKIPQRWLETLHEGDRIRQIARYLRGQNVQLNEEL